MQAASSDLKINYYSGKALCFEEVLSDELNLIMVQIPAGQFTMGSPEDEVDRSDSEGPQRPVTLPRFFMGKYPVTQAQWRVVAQMKTVDRDLELEPANLKGNDRPVEKVSWHEALEFCARLSKRTGRFYTLPSEAQWEYACRGGTGTIAPFHYGETITTDLANYRGTDWEEVNESGSYGRGPKGDFRAETTSVGKFPANDFGLYDMHGNVWEWCLDHWHDNYEGAPKDGSAWLSSVEVAPRVLRGGSWYHNPGHCRSAARLNNLPGTRYYYNGIRVVCLP